MTKIISRLCFPALLALSLQCGGEDLYSLAVKVTGFEMGKGQIIISIFESEDKFLEQALHSKTISVGQSDTLLTHFEKMPVGVYAVTAVYDEDSNGELNTGFLGIPTELVGVSNDAKGFLGPPSFDDAKFSFNASEEISIRLGKAKD